MKRKNKGILCFSCAAIAALFLAAASGLQAAPQTSTQPQVLSNAVASEPIQFDVSPPLTTLMTTVPAQKVVRQTHATMKKKQQFTGAKLSQGTNAASALHPLTGPLVSATTHLGIEGVGEVGGFYGTPEGISCPNVSGGGYLVPPDTNAAVGDTQVVQWINVCYAVFDKSSGALIAGPFPGTNFWAGFGAPCETNNDGDIIIQWDKANHRWLAAQNVFNGPPYYTCVAVSQTADATGSYYRYTFPQPGFPDYPKWGLTSSTYYQTQNIFGFGPVGFGVNVCAYDTKNMLKGSSKASQVCIFDDSNGTAFDDNMLPADDDTETNQNSEVLLGSIDNFLPGDSHVYEYVFKPNFGNPAKSTLAGVNGSMPISVPAFDVSWVTCVPQPDNPASEAFFAFVWGFPPGTTGLVDCLDTLGDRLMYRLAHFNQNGTQHFLVAHSVLNTTGVATRWYEFRSQGLGNTNLSLYQAGQTPDDGEYRWMGSVAMDKMGDIAVGYSRSSAAAGDFPSIYYAGQTAGDPLGTTETEALIKQGSGSQYFSFNRWGDYSSMALDGSDSCTFWYTTEYYPVDGSFAFDTWISSLKFPKCH
jgi:hypothetical protein